MHQFVMKFILVFVFFVTSNMGMEEITLGEANTPLEVTEISEESPLLNSIENENQDRKLCEWYAKECCLCTTFNVFCWPCVLSNICFLGSGALYRGCESCVTGHESKTNDLYFNLLCGMCYMCECDFFSEARQRKAMESDSYF